MAGIEVSRANFIFERRQLNLAELRSPYYCRGVIKKKRNCTYLNKNYIYVPSLVTNSYLTTRQNLRMFWTWKVLLLQLIPGGNKYFKFNFNGRHIEKHHI